MAKANEIHVRVLKTGKIQTVDAWESPVCQVWWGHRQRRGSLTPKSSSMPVDSVTDTTVIVGGAEMARNPRYGKAEFQDGDLVWVVSKHVVDGKPVAYVCIILDERTL